jgi:hypothetical protein
MPLDEQGHSLTARGDDATAGRAATRLPSNTSYRLGRARRDVAASQRVGGRFAWAMLSVEDSSSWAHAEERSGATKNGRPQKPSTLPWAPAWRWTGASGTLPLHLTLYTPRSQKL